MTTETDFISLQQAAKLAGVTDRCIRKAIQRGDFEAHTDSLRRRFVRRQDILRWTPGRPGRPIGARKQRG